MYARRNIPAARSLGVLEKIDPLLGDGIHDTDLMLWMSGARVETAAEAAAVAHAHWQLQGGGLVVGRVVGRGRRSGR